MDPSPRTPSGSRGLSDEALGWVAGSLDDVYSTLYEQRGAGARASLTGNTLAFAFEGGLSGADECLLDRGKDEQLRQFREHFFDVIDEQMIGIVAEVTGKPVTYSFYGFDSRTRTTHAIFVLDLGEQRESDAGEEEAEPPRCSAPRP